MGNNITGNDRTTVASNSGHKDKWRQHGLSEALTRNGPEAADGKTCATHNSKCGQAMAMGRLCLVRAKQDPSFCHQTPTRELLPHLQLRSFRFRSGCQSPEAENCMDTLFKSLAVLHKMLAATIDWKIHLFASYMNCLLRLCKRILAEVGKAWQVLVFASHAHGP